MAFHRKVIKYSCDLFDKSKRNSSDMKAKELFIVACANRNDRNWNSDNRSLGRSDDNGRMAQPARTIMKTLYQKIYDFNNMFLAHQKARKGKTKRSYVLKFEENLEKNLLDLQFELKTQIYSPKPLKTFILRDPKTRKISKSDFRDRIVHHAIVNILEPIFDKSFIYDSCANRKGKGTLFATKRLEKFIRKVSKNNTAPCFVLKADIKHYFQEVNLEILLEIIKRKIKDKKSILLINKILSNGTVGIRGGGERQKGMPLGNLTSQFFANVYLNQLDHYVKRRLQAKYYIRYVDDFIIVHNSRRKLGLWKSDIENFLKEKLILNLHPDKSNIISLSKGIDFIGFRNFYFYKLLRKRNIKKILAKIQSYHARDLTKEEILEIFQGWNAYAKQANAFNLRKKIVKCIYRP